MTTLFISRNCSTYSHLWGSNKCLFEADRQDPYKEVVGMAQVKVDLTLSFVQGFLSIIRFFVQALKRLPVELFERFVALFEPLSYIQLRAIA